MAAETSVEQRIYDRSSYNKHFREALIWKLPPKKGLDKAAQKVEAARRPPGCEQTVLDSYQLQLPKLYDPNEK
jgi:hypothetical protein